MNNSYVYSYIHKDNENKFHFSIIPEDTCQFLGTLGIGKNSPQGIYATNYFKLTNLLKGIDPSKKMEIPIENGFVAEIDNNISTEQNIKNNLEKFFKWTQEYCLSTK